MMYKPLNKMCALNKQYFQKTCMMRFDDQNKQMLRVMLFGLVWLGVLDGTKLPLIFGCHTHVRRGE